MMTIPSGKATGAETRLLSAAIASPDNRSYDDDAPLLGLSVV
ncbi:hypothetical protein AB0F43_22115 [Kribbella sp. NPDC023972]